MKFLLLAIPLVEAFIKLVGIEPISKSLENNCSCPLQNETACPGHCESGWAYFKKTDACYKVFYWEEFDIAESICDMKGGHLASIHSFEENEFVIDLAKTGVKGITYVNGTWIGLKFVNNSLSSNWMWTDGTKVDYTPWCCGQQQIKTTSIPCVQVYCDYMSYPVYKYRKWDNRDCSLKMRTFVCKKTALH